MKFALKLLSTAAVIFFPQWATAGAVDQLHQFLAHTRTLKAEFSQVVIGKGGRTPQQSSGTVAISRPGKLRWDIQKPYPQLVLGDGDAVRRVRELVRPPHDHQQAERQAQGVAKHHGVRGQMLLELGQ